MINFLKKMSEYSQERADLLPDRIPSEKLDLAVFKIKFSDFDIIAEFKHTSPAEGKLAQLSQECGAQASKYAKGGAAAISILTEPSRFNGKIEHLYEVASNIKESSLPAMRKDFLVDTKQIIESRKYGASGLLLIANLLPLKMLRNMLDCAFEHSMFVLLESFDEDDIQKSLMLLKESRYQEKAQEKQLLFGVNSRDLKTLQVNFNRFEEFATKMPSDIIKVAESGINNSNEILSVKKNGYQMALIGSALMKSTQPELMIREYLIQGRGQK